MITYTGTGDYRANRTGPRDTAAIDPRTDPRPGGGDPPPRPGGKGLGGGLPPRAKRGGGGAGGGGVPGPTPREID